MAFHKRARQRLTAAQFVFTDGQTHPITRFLYCMLLFAGVFFATFGFSQKKKINVFYAQVIVNSIYAH